LDLAVHSGRPNPELAIVGFDFLSLLNLLFDVKSKKLIDACSY